MLPSNTELANEVEQEINSSLVLLGFLRSHDNLMDWQRGLIDEVCQRIGEDCVRDLRRIKNVR